MKTLMISLMTLLFAVSANAQPELRQKPVQCGAFAEVYEAYIKPNNLSPMFTGVATIQTQTYSNHLCLYVPPFAEFLPWWGVSRTQINLKFFLVWLLFWDGLRMLLSWNRRH